MILNSGKLYKIFNFNSNVIWIEINPFEIGELPNGSVAMFVRWQLDEKYETYLYTFYWQNKLITLESDVFRAEEIRL